MAKPAKSGVLPGPSKVLEEMLWEWTMAQERSCRLWGWNDAPWWHGERASVSTLAGAVWCARGIALEEYSVSKSKRESSRHKGMFRGRNDLYFKLGKSEFILEAKQYWPNLRTADLRKGLKQKLRAARMNVKSMKAEGARRLAAVFVTGRIPERFVNNSGEFLQGLVEVLERIGGTARAWTFPEGTTKLIDGKRTRRWYPGAAIVIEQV